MNEKKRDEYRDEVELMDYFQILWKRKWGIVLPACLLVAVVTFVSFLLPKIWEVDAIILPSKFTIQTEQGNFEEVVVVPASQIVGQINQKSFDHRIAVELGLDLRKFPKLRAENLRDTDLVRVSAKVDDPEKTKSVLLSLFNHLKTDLDKKVEVQMKSIETQIENKTNEIQHKNLVIKDNLNEIKLCKIEKNKTKQAIVSSGNMSDISKDRVKSIMEEMKSVKERIAEIEGEQKKALAEDRKGADALSLLLYSNEVQTNFRYYNTLDEKLSNERITQENLNLLIKEKEEEIKQLDTQIENLNNQIDKVKNEIKDIETDIEFLKNKKDRIDYTELVKQPTTSIYPVAPRKLLNAVISGIIGFLIFTILTLFMEYYQKQKDRFQDR